MQNTILAALGLAFGLFAAWRLMTALKAKADQARARTEALAASVGAALTGVSIIPGQAAGVLCFEGRRQGRLIRVMTIADTLATRKLPSWWLSVTLQEPVACPATIDVMARPDMPASFSNFHLRAHAIRPPPGMPELVAIRADQPQIGPLDQTIAAFAGLFADRRMKELLISPHGVRLVWLMAEADRLRYGVFRQADFGDQVPSPDLIGRLADQAVAIAGTISPTRDNAA